MELCAVEDSVLEACRSTVVGCVLYSLYLYDGAGLEETNVEMLQVVATSHIFLGCVWLAAQAAVGGNFPEAKSSKLRVEVGVEIQ